MKIGKLTNSELKSLILDNIKIKNSDILLSPSIGEDCSAIDFGGECCVLTTDPISGTESEIGKLAVHIVCNDIASSGATPLAILVNILVPATASIEDIGRVVKDLNTTADSVNVDIIGGHTEVTDAVNRFVVVCTGVGRTSTSRLLKTSGAKPGDDIILTKTAGLEGTAIIAAEKKNELASTLAPHILERALKFSHNISVINEGRICSGLSTVNAMHDVTEGGLLGALWEMSEASGCGVVAYNDKIPVAEETTLICNYFKINPLKLISSGCMLIATSNGEEVVKSLLAENIQATIIGKFTDNPEKILVLEDNKSEILSEPESDELYKI